MLLLLAVLWLMNGNQVGGQLLAKTDKLLPLPKTNPWIDNAKWWSRAPVLRVEPPAADLWSHSPLGKPPETGDSWKRQIGYNADPTVDPDAMKVASKQAELQSLLQQIYQAEAAVKMETGEVTRTQQVASEAEQSLEEATNKVRMLSSDLQAAQEAAAQAAMRAHTAQLQLSAHDQLMFTARQRVDALSAQMVSVQAELAAAQQMFTLSNSSHNLEAQARNAQIPLQEMEVALAPESYGPMPPYIPEPYGPAKWGPPPMAPPPNSDPRAHPPPPLPYLYT